MSPAPKSSLCLCLGSSLPGSPPSAATVSRLRSRYGRSYHLLADPIAKPLANESVAGATMELAMPFSPATASSSEVIDAAPVGVTPNVPPVNAAPIEAEPNEAAPTAAVTATSSPPRPERLVLPVQGSKAPGVQGSRSGRVQGSKASGIKDTRAEPPAASCAASAPSAVPPSSAEAAEPATAAPAPAAAGPMPTAAPLVPAADAAVAASTASAAAALTADASASSVPTPSDTPSAVLEVSAAEAPAEPRRRSSFERVGFGPGESVLSYSLAQAADPPAEGSDGECPEALRRRGLEALAATLEADSAAAWERLKPVKARQFFTTATLRGRAGTIWRGFGAERMEWDKTLQAPFVYLLRHGLASDPSTTIDVLAYASNPAAGGMISGRSFVDLRTTRVSYRTEGGQRLMHIESAVVGALAEGDADADVGAAGWLVMADGLKLLRGRNLLGSGCTLRERLEAGEVVVDVHMINASLIGGRLPISIINGATAGAMAAIVGGLDKYLRSRAV